MQIHFYREFPFSTLLSINSKQNCTFPNQLPYNAFIHTFTNLSKSKNKPGKVLLIPLTTRRSEHFVV